MEPLGSAVDEALARTRAVPSACMHRSEELPAMHAAPSFDEAVAELERAARQAIRGPNRDVARAAYEQAPEGVTCCVREASRRGKQPISLFLRMLRDGDHFRHETVY